MTAGIVEMILLHLTTKHRSTVATPHKASHWIRVLACAIGVVIVLLDDFLNIIKELLGDERRKVRLTGSGSCFFKPLDDRVCQEMLGGFPTDLFTTSCLQTSLVEIGRQRLIRILAGGIEFKSQLDVRSTDVVDDKRFGLLIV